MGSLAIFGPDGVQYIRLRYERFPHKRLSSARMWLSRSQFDLEAVTLYNDVNLSYSDSQPMPLAYTIRQPCTSPNTHVDYKRLHALLRTSPPPAQHLCNRRPLARTPDRPSCSKVTQHPLFSFRVTREQYAVFRRPGRARSVASVSVSRAA